MPTYGIASEYTVQNTRMCLQLFSIVLMCMGGGSAAVVGEGVELHE